MRAARQNLAYRFLWPFGIASHLQARRMTDPIFAPFTGVSYRYPRLEFLELPKSQSASIDRFKQGKTNGT
jgi:hypothetical protein